MQQKISTGYSPRVLQQQIHSSLKRFNVLVCHRRFGKTVLCVNELIDRCILNNLPNPRYGYVAPLLSQAKKVAWDYLKDHCRNIPGTTFNENELRADLPGGRRIYIIGADNPDAHRGTYFDGIILDEYSQFNPSAWTEVFRPALSDRKGFAIFIGTPKGRNSFYDLYEMAKRSPGWYAAMFKASDTGIIDDNELRDLKNEMGEDAYNQEYECSFTASVAGTYYSKEITKLENEGKITSVSYDPSLGVITAWDLGIGDSTAIWFAQKLFLETRLIDYVEVNGLSIPDIVKILKDKPYVYTTHLLPHDAGARELGTGVTRQETLRKHGVVGTVLGRGKIDDGIQASRNLLAMCWFDAVNCAVGLECLREYRRDWDEKAQMFKSSPLHNKYSHGADAFRMLAMGLHKERPLIEPERAEKAIMDYDELKGIGFSRRPTHYET
jgi:phage terminase large subunit